MKIHIAGTRGVPNRYGGFEQCAQFLGPRFVQAGHQVTIYNPSYHPFTGAEWEGVKLVRMRSLEPKLGMMGNALYDRDCIRHAHRHGADILLSLGYAPSSLFFPRARPRATRIVTNMDGLEWKRTKWSPAIQRLLRFLEKRGVHRSHALVADNEGIQEYLKEEYGVPSFCIAYGGDHVLPGRREDLAALGLEQSEFDCLIARLEPENNVEMVIDGHLQSGASRPLVVVGPLTTPLGKQLAEKYKATPTTALRFVGGIYDANVLNALRTHARIYLHGHSVGGTNPSLLEAMAAGSCIAAHDNPFNRHVLGENATYFASAQEVSKLSSTPPKNSQRAFNQQRIRQRYTWDFVASQYLSAFEETMSSRQSAVL